jgi:hypothetical protein
VSLSWREQLLISLAPGEVSWLRLAGAFKSKLIGKGILPVEAAYGTRPWDGAIAALRAETSRWSRDRLSVRVVLSNHFVRYALVPPSSQVSGHAEELALARFHFNKIHGDASRGWDIRLSPGRSGTPRPACAVDSALLDALKQSFPADKRPRLDSVQPLLMSAYNMSGSTIPSAGAWLVMAEPDRACVALLKGRTWQAVQNVKGQFNDVASWIALVERERWRVSLDTVPDTLLIHATQSSTLAQRAYGAWKVAALQPRWPAGLLPTRDGAYIRALSAA